MEEETGLRCRLERELAGVSYRDRKGRPKIVRYWVMRPLGGSFAPNDEVDRAEWRPIDAALDELTYEHDRMLLRMFQANGASSGRPPALPPDAPTVPVYVVRHAKAGSRDDWTEDDELRPLDEAGFLQAERLVDMLDSLPVERVVSSPTVRCIETVELLARTRGIEVEVDDRLGEGAGPRAVNDILREAGDRPTVLCTHGDVIEIVLDSLQKRGVIGEDDGRSMKKGSTWVVDMESGRPVRAHYLPPP